MKKVLADRVSASLLSEARTALFAGVAALMNKDHTILPHNLRLLIKGIFQH